MTSPCSVTLNRPSTEPGAWASTARPAGPPPRPSAPPRPWKRVSRTSRRAAQAVSCGLRVVERQRRGDRAEFLGRVGVAEHDLQPPAARPRSRAATGSSAEHLVQDAGGVCQVSPVSNSGTTSSTGGSPRRVASRASSYTARDVGGGPGEADHVPAAGVHAEPVLDPAPSPGTWRGPRRSARTASPPASHLAQRAGVHRAVLADLQPGQVEAERLAPARSGAAARRTPGGRAPAPARASCTSRRSARNPRRPG